VPTHESITSPNPFVLQAADQIVQAARGLGPRCASTGLIALNAAQHVEDAAKDGRVASLSARTRLRAGEALQ
jgi:hypothetical protein